MVPQQAYTMPGASMALSVADNLLLTHHLRTGVALVIDVCFSPAHPLAPPLPIGLPPEVSPHRSIAQSTNGSFAVWACFVTSQGAVSLRLVSCRRGGCAENGVDWMLAQQQCHVVPYLHMQHAWLLVALCFVQFCLPQPSSCM